MGIDGGDRLLFKLWWANSWTTTTREFPPSGTAESKIDTLKAGFPGLPSNFLVVMAVDSMLRRAAGRKLESSDFTTRHLSGRSVRVLAFGLAFLPLASRMTTRERAAGKS